MFALQREFVGKAFLQTKVQRELAKEAFRFLAVAIHTERKRSAIIKSEILQYYQILEELYGPDLMPVERRAQLEKGEE